MNKSKPDDINLYITRTAPKELWRNAGNFYNVWKPTEDLVFPRKEHMQKAHSIESEYEDPVCFAFSTLG